MKIQRLVEHCIAEVLTESDPPQEYWRDTFGQKMPSEFTVETSQPLRKNAMVDRDKPCTHPNGFEFSGKTPGTGYEVCKMCGTKKDTKYRKTAPHLGQFEALVKECVLDVLKENLTTPLREALTPKAVAVIQKWQQQLGDNRKVAVKLVDYALFRKIGLTSSDLADTTTFSNGLDMIEQHLEDGNYRGAFNVAKDTADEMIADEGGAGMDEGTSGNSLVLTPTGQSDDWSRPVYTDQTGKIYVDINLGQGEPSIHSVTDDGEPDMPICNYTIAEGFDPLSQGPNPDCKENPYPEWNAHMRSLEEDGQNSKPTGETFVDHPINPYPENRMEEKFGEDAGKWLRRLVVAGLLSWASLTSDGRDAVKTAFYALQIKSPEKVSTAVAKQIEDDLPMNGDEIDGFIESQYDRIEQVKKHYGPASKAIFKLDFLFRPEKGNATENDHGRYAQEAGAGQFDPRTFGPEKDPLSDKLVGIDDRADVDRAKAAAMDYLKKMRAQALK